MHLNAENNKLKEKQKKSIGRTTRLYIQAWPHEVPAGRLEEYRKLERITKKNQRNMQVPVYS